MKARGWDIEVDSHYGDASERVCRAFQREKGLVMDGILGPDTWRASWDAAVR
jgi:peptidoglycan hydrolase-like protein with peptidoglycan-binding domain